jgi:hypothetical protein
VQSGSLSYSVLPCHTMGKGEIKSSPNFEFGGGFMKYFSLQSAQNHSIKGLCIAFTFQSPRKCVIPSTPWIKIERISIFAPKFLFGIRHFLLFTAYGQHSLGADYVWCFTRTLIQSITVNAITRQGLFMPPLPLPLPLPLLCRFATHRWVQNLTEKKEI